MNSEFTLVPYVGPEPVTFDMTASDVERALGQAQAISLNDFGERDECRGPLSIRYSMDDGKVVELAFDPKVKVLFHGENLFEHPALIQFLLQFDSKPFEWVGFLIFLELGITVAGFHDGDESQKGITVFRKGRWDDFRNEFIVFRPVQK